MGAAEQRQVRTGVAERVREETERRRLQGAYLSEIRQSRTNLEDHNLRTPGLKRHLRANVILAILHSDPPADEEVAREAGWTVGDVEQLRREVAERPQPAGD